MRAATSNMSSVWNFRNAYGKYLQGVLLETTAANIVDARAGRLKWYADKKRIYATEAVKRSAG